MGVKTGIDMEMVLMGYNLKQLIEIIREHKKYQFYAGQQWTDAEMQKLKERQKEVNKDHIMKMQFTPEMTKQEAEEKLYRAGLPKDMSTGEFLILNALEALGMIKFKEPEKEKPAFEIQTNDGGFIYIYANGEIDTNNAKVIGSRIVNRIPQLIAEAKQK